MKKSGFMKRLEEAQKAQQAQLERQKQQRENNRRRWEVESDGIKRNAGCFGEQPAFLFMRMPIH